MLPASVFQGFFADISATLLVRIRDALPEDSSLDIVISAVAEANKPPSSVAGKFKEYRMEDGLPLYQGCIVVSDEPELKQEPLSNCHDTSAAGFQGRAQTLELIARHYFWSAMKFQVNRYVDSCEICQHSYSLFRSFHQDAPVIKGAYNGQEFLARCVIVKLSW